MLAWNIIILIILILLSGFFSGVEVALVSVSQLKLRTWLKQRKKGASALRELKSNPRRMIITILIGNNLVNISASVIATIVATDLFGSTGAGIAIGVMTFLILVFGEITPKAYTSTHFEKVSLLMAKPVLILMKLLWPIVRIFEFITNSFLKLFGGAHQKRKFMCEDELKMAFDLSAEEKVIEKNEHDLLRNVLEFNDITAREVMTLKKDMFCIDANTKIKDSISIVTSGLYSRIPLFEDSREKIVGIVHIKDILEAINNGDKDLLLREIAVRPFFIGAGIKLNDIFKRFQETHIHIAIVRDKNKKVIGLVTIEDLLEELVGEIIDESDITPNKIMRLDKKSVLVDGETTPRYIRSFFHVDIPQRFKTLSDYLIDKTGGVPKRGSILKIGSTTFIIEEVGEEYIERIVIKKGSG